MNTSKLNEKALLVHLRISMWSGSRKNKKLTSEVCAEHDAENDAGSWWTYYVPKADLKPLQQTANQCRAIWVKYTLPWMDGGLRVLPSAKLMEYSKDIRKAIRKFDREVKRFQNRWPEIYESMRERLGSLVNDKDLMERMPTQDSVVQKFSIQQDLLPIPKATDFRINLSDTDQTQLRQQMQKSIGRMTAKTMEEVWHRLDSLVGRVHTALTEPDKKFKNSLISNLRKFCKDLPNLNLTEDENLNTMRRQIIKSLARIDPEDLRENKSYRKASAKKAKLLLDKLEQYK